MESKIRYVERKEEGLVGPASIGRVSYSKTGKSLYYRGQTFQSLKGGYKANFYDVETGARYWISGCRKDGADRLYTSNLPVEVDDDVREEYWTKIRNLPERRQKASTP